MNKKAILKLAAKFKRLRHEEHFNQGTWATKTACGTSACIAGHAVLMEGYRFVKKHKLQSDFDLCAKGKDGEELHILTVATSLLGLEPLMASGLFYSSAQYWPYKYAQRYYDAFDTGERRSRIVAEMLEAIAERGVTVDMDTYRLVLGEEKK